MKPSAALTNAAHRDIDAAAQWVHCVVRCCQNAASITESLAIARGDDVDDAITIGDTVLSRGHILGAATSVAERVAQAERVAVLATPRQRPFWQ